MLLLLFAGLASPAVAASEEEGEPEAPEWDLGLVPREGAFGSFFRRLSGTAPGAVRARFGLGLDAFFEHQESLRITGMESAFTLRDLVLGDEESGVLHGDPGLLNRKFDIEWEMEGAGVELPIALPRLGGFTKSTLVLRAATADVTLDFLDRVQPQDSTSLSGRGALFGAEVNVVAALNGPWFTEASYGFQKIPSFTVERSPRFAPGSLRVLADEVRLGRDVQEIAARIGYGFPGNRITAYTGVLHRRTELDVEDELRYVDSLGATETRLSSRTELDSEATLAVAGLDYRLGPRLSGRLETSVGEEDWGVVLRVAYRKRQAVRPSPEKGTEVEDRAREIAMAIAQRLAQVEADFLAGWKNLTVVEGPSGRPAYLVREISNLLTQTEQNLLGVLGNYPELEPLGDWVEDEFQSVRDEFASETRYAALFPELPQMQADLVALRPPRAFLSDTTIDLLAQVDGVSTDLEKATRRLRRIQRLITFVRSSRLRMVLEFWPSLSLGESAKITIYPRNDPGSPTCKKTLGPGDAEQIFIGRYYFRLENSRDKNLPFCNAKEQERGLCPLDLLREECVTLECNKNRCRKEDCL